MTSLSLAGSCGGTAFCGISNPPVLHHMARSKQILSQELLRTAFSSAVIGTTVTLSAFYAGRVLYVVPSEDELTHSSQWLGHPAGPSPSPGPHGAFTWLEYPNAVPRKMEIFSEDPVPLGSYSSPFCRSDSEQLERAFDTLRYQHDLKILGVPSVVDHGLVLVTRSTVSGSAYSSGTSTYIPTQTSGHHPVPVTPRNNSRLHQGSQEYDGDDDDEDSDPGPGHYGGAVGRPSSTLSEDLWIHGFSAPPPPPPPPPPSSSVTGDEDDDYGSGWMLESTWKFFTYGALCGLMIRLARRYHNNDGLKILASDELELEDRVISVNDLGFDVITVDIAPSGTHTSTLASSSEVILFDQAVYPPFQRLSDGDYILYQPTPISGDDDSVPESSGITSRVTNVILAFLIFLSCIVSTSGFRITGYVFRRGVPTVQGTPFDGLPRLDVDNHEHAEHIASADASEELEISLGDEVEVDHIEDIIPDTPALVSVATLSIDNVTVDENSLENLEELDLLDAEEDNVDDVTEASIESLISADGVPDAGNQLIGSVSSMCGTSTAAKELNKTLPEASNVVDLHIQNVTSHTEQSSPKSDTSQDTSSTSINIENVLNAIEVQQEQTLYSSMWAPKPGDGPDLVDEGNKASPKVAPFETGRLSNSTKKSRRKPLRRATGNTHAEVVQKGDDTHPSASIARSPQPIRPQAVSAPNSDGEDRKPRNHRNHSRGAQGGMMPTSQSVPDWANAP